MTRPRLIRTASTPYHITARTNNRDWYSVPLTEIWSVYEAALAETQERYGLILHAFVLMGNHFHLIALTPRENISEAMRYLLTEVSRDVGKLANRINHIFGGRYRWSIPWTSRDLAYVYKYVLRNPVRAGLCARVENYDFSTFSLSLANRCRIAIADGIGPLWSHVPKEPAARARWLNTSPSSEAEKLISLGLRRYEFALPDHPEMIALRDELARSYGVENDGVDATGCG